MSVELRPLGVKCNLACQYCYQNMHRNAANECPRYDLDAMKQAVCEEGGPFHLFGGEPLLMKFADLAEMFRWGLETFGENSIQTNGALITRKHIDLFRQYDVMVGVSVDGPGELNDARWAGTLEKTRAATEKTQAAIRMMCARHLAPALMLQLTRCNATARRLPRLLAWIREMAALGVCSMRVHLLEMENSRVREKYGLSTEENLYALEQFTALDRQLPGLRIDIPADLRALLLGDDSEVPCVWRACDPYTTEAVIGVNGEGRRHNCGLTDKEGIHFQKPDRQGFERYLALYHTPQAHHGCKGCRFFLVCKGQCPGTAVDRDWRNRTEYCEVWKRLFSQIESRLAGEGYTPVSLHPLREQWERQMRYAWQCNDNYSLKHDLKADEHVSASQRRNPPEMVMCRSGDPPPEPQTDGKDMSERSSERPEDRLVKTLDFELHAFRRITWVSAEMRATWEPVITGLGELLREYLPVVWRRLYPLQLCRLYPHKLSRYKHRLNTAATVLEIPDELLNRCLPGFDFDDRKITVLAGAEEEAQRFMALPALSLSSEDTAVSGETLAALHRALGAPGCCSRFTARLLKDGRRESIRPMAEPENAGGGSLRQVAGHFTTNIFLAPMGLRLLRHLPCSPRCKGSIALGKATLAGLRDVCAHNKQPLLDRLQEILSWSYNWSSLHGIAELKSPIFKMIVNSQPLAHKVQVHWQGSREPATGRKGLEFPY
jgi:uncharacterized protein